MWLNVPCGPEQVAGSLRLKLTMPDALAAGLMFELPPPQLKSRTAAATAIFSNTKYFVQRMKGASVGPNDTTFSSNVRIGESALRMPPVVES
jgi:hypothetical protein